MVKSAVAMVWLGLAGCEHGQAPGLAERNPALRVTDPIVPVSQLSPSGPSHLTFEVELLDDACTPYDDSLVGTFRGSPMTVVSRGELGGACGNVTLSIDPSMLTPGGTTIEVHDDSGSVSATFDDGLLDERQVVTGSFDFHSNIVFEVVWSDPDLPGALPPRVEFRELFDGPCMGGCFGAQFEAIGTVIDQTHVEFTPVFFTATQNGEAVFQPGAVSGQVLACEARTCSFELSHAVVHAATATL